MDAKVIALIITLIVLFLTGAGLAVWYFWFYYSSVSITGPNAGATGATGININTNSVTFGIGETLNGANNKIYLTFETVAGPTGYYVSFNDTNKPSAIGESRIMTVDKTTVTFDSTAAKSAFNEVFNSFTITTNPSNTSVGVIKNLSLQKHYNYF